MLLCTSWCQDVHTGKNNNTGAAHSCCLLLLCALCSCKGKKLTFSLRVQQKSVSHPCLLSTFPSNVAVNALVSEATQNWVLLFALVVDSTSTNPNPSVIRVSPELTTVRDKPVNNKNNKNDKCLIVWKTISCKELDQSSVLWRSLGVFYFLKRYQLVLISSYNLECLGFGLWYKRNMG